MSRYYVTDPSDPDAPVVLDHYDGPHGRVAAGNLVAYVNPAGSHPRPSRTGCCWSRRSSRSAATRRRRS